MSTKEQFAFVFNAFRGLQTVQVISLGLELGLIGALEASETGLNPTTLAQQHGLHEPYVLVWCETGYALGVLEVNDEGQYHLPDGLDTVLLDREHSRYLGSFVRGFMSDLADDFSKYPEAFRTGKVYPFWEHGTEFSDWVSEVTHPMQRLVVGRVLPELFGDVLAGNASVLDVGCGAGRLIFKLVDAYPNLQLAGVDVDPHGIQLAQQQAEQRQIGDHVAFRHVNSGEFGYSDQFDLALMFEVFHEIPVAERPGVLAATYQALKPGGKLFIVDETWPETATQLRDPAYAFSVMVQFSELIWGNVVSTESQQTALLTAAGFHNLQRGDLGGTFTTIIAHKSV